MNWRKVLIAVGAGLLLACAHGYEARRSGLVRRVHEANARNEERALTYFARREGVTLLESVMRRFEDPGHHFNIDPHQSEQAARAKKLSFDLRGQEFRLTMNWHEFDARMRRDGMAEATSQSGEPALLLMQGEGNSCEPGNIHFVRTREGRLLRVKTVLRTLVEHRLTYPGNCDRSFVFEDIPQMWCVQVLAGVRPTDLEDREVLLPYEGESLHVDCATYTE